MAENQQQIEAKRQQAIQEFKRLTLEQKHGADQWVPKADKVTEWALMEIAEYLKGIHFQLTRLTMAADQIKTALEAVARKS